MCNRRAKTLRPQKPRAEWAPTGLDVLHSADSGYGWSIDSSGYWMCIERAQVRNTAALMAVAPLAALVPIGRRRLVHARPA